MSNRTLLPAVLASLLVVGIHGLVAADSVSWRNHLDGAKIEAAQSGKLVLLHFYTTTCGPCRMLDENVFSQPQMGDEVERNFVPVKINADENPALASAYRVERVPSEIVLNSQGNVVASLSCPQSPSEYSSQLANVANHYRSHTAGQGTPTQAPVQAAYAGLQVGGYANQSVTSQSITTQPAPAPQTTFPAQATPANSTNPYVAANAGYSPVASNAYGNPAIAQSNTSSASTTMPPNAMPNSYRQQSAPVQQPAQQTLATTSPATSQQVINNSAASMAQAGAGAQVSPVSHMSVARQLPPGSPPLAFDGYCPVALKSVHKWVAGDLKFGAIHRGRTFLFVGEEQRQQFLANPDAYCPVFSGIDPVLLLDNNQVIEGSRRFGFEYRGAFYLFANQESMSRFKSQPDQYAAGVRQAMARMEAPGENGTILR